MHAYHYIAVFPRQYDAPRPAWPADVVTRLEAIPDVVDAIFPDLTAAWVGAGAGEGAIRRESRRRFVEVYASSSSSAAARKTRDALVKLLGELRDALDAELERDAGPSSPVTLVTIPVEAVEVL